MPTTTTRYSVMNGRMISQTRNGVRRLFRRDPQGNVVGLYNDSQVRTNDFRYWSYGGLRSGDATATDFLFRGTWGSRRDSTSAIYDRWNYYDPSRISQLGGTPGQTGMIDDSCRKTVGQEIVKQWEVMLKKLCEAVGKPNSRTAKCIRDCLADAGLGNPTAIECLTKRCGKPSILKCTSSDELNCPTKNKAPCCQKDGVWKDIMMPPCASTGCTGGRNVFDPGAITVVCNSWLTWSDKCSNPSPCGQGSLGGNDPTHLVTIVHEFLHACAECPAPEVPHKNQFNDAAKCILQNCLGYRI